MIASQQEIITALTTAYLDTGNINTWNGTNVLRQPLSITYSFMSSLPNYYTQVVIKDEEIDKEFNLSSISLFTQEQKDK